MPARATSRSRKSCQLPASLFWLLAANHSWCGRRSPPVLSSAGHVTVAARCTFDQKPVRQCLWKVERSFPNRRSGDEERLSLLFLKSFPFQLGNFLNQFLHQMVVVHGLANALLPGFGDTDLAKLPRLALHQVQRLMQFPTGTTAIRLATSARTFRESATKKPLTRRELRNPRAEVALRGGEFAAVQGVAHVLYL
jgi:hypothetical protein